MLNKVTLIGNLGADPQLRTTHSGTAVCNLSLATNERVKDREGNWTDHTEWHRVVCFGKVAENVAKYMEKGKRILIEGSLRTTSWVDSEGTKRYTTQINANKVLFL